MSEPAIAHLHVSAVAESITLAIQVYEAATAAGLKSVADGGLALANTILDDVNRIAVEIATLADSLIVFKMLASHAKNRPLEANMETHVASLPGVLGSVDIALLAELDKIVNPLGWKPYWRAQEFGTGSDQVKTQEGRTFLGTFEPSGEAPDSAYRAPEVGHDLAFVSSRGPDAGMGRISVELPGRHFLKEGVAEAAARWKAAIETAQAQWLARIKELMEMVRVATVRPPATHTWVINA